MAKVFKIMVPDNSLISRTLYIESLSTELYVIDRADKKFVAEHSDDLNKPALYILANRDEKKLYVGKTGDSIKRLRNHEAKDFWTEAIVYHSNPDTDTLSTTEVEWLEAKTYDTIKELGYYDLSENKQKPKYPTLKRDQKINCPEYFETAKNYICAAGFDFFLKKKAVEQHQNETSGAVLDTNSQVEDAGWRESYDVREDAPKKYSLNGGKMLPANQFILKAVKAYKDTHQQATFADFQKAFPDPKTEGYYGCIRSLDYINKKSYTGHRYFTKPDEVIISSDNVKFVVSTQWSWHNAPAYALLIKSLGFDVKVEFSRKPKTPTPQDKIVTNLTADDKIECMDTTGGIDAKGILLVNEQKLIVLKGSIIKTTHVPKLKPDLAKKWYKLVKKHTKLEGDKRVVKHDVTFDSPSGAGFFCGGRTSNGWEDWHDLKGNELKIYRE